MKASLKILVSSKLEPEFNSLPYIFFNHKCFDPSGNLNKASCHEEGFMIDSHIRGYLMACKNFDVISEIEVSEMMNYANSKYDENLKPNYL